MQCIRPDRSVVSLCLGAVMLAASVWGAEVTVRNDSLQSGGIGYVDLGFVAGESAAARLTSPCSGYIVAVQVLWVSAFGGEPDTLGDSITVFAGATFPMPGEVLHNGYAPYQEAIFEGPVLVDGVLNEFRYLDEYQTIPLQVPVSSGQVFVVSFKFLDDVQGFGPSVVTDTGCQTGKNALFAIPGGWLNACALGVSGDFVIRAVVYCGELAGACCMPDGSCLQNFTFQCAAAGGIFHGAGTSCTPNPCPQPVGACCFGTVCAADQTEAACAGSGGDWVGPLTTCGPPDPCQAPSGCPGDSNCDGGISWRDIDYFVAAISGEQPWRDMFSPGTPSCPYANNDANGDGAVSWRDIDPFVALMNTACP